MSLDEARRKGKAQMWLDGIKTAWGMFGGDIEDWIRDGWDKVTAQEAIEESGGTVDWGDEGPPKDVVEAGGSTDFDWGHVEFDTTEDNGPPPGTIPEGASWHFEIDPDQPDGVLGTWNLYNEGGSVEGPGTETSDDIPALLSDGEFVIKASAVKGLGRSKGAKDDKEARDKGIELLYELQRKYGDLEEYSDGGAAFGDVLAERRLLDRNRLRGGY